MQACNKENGYETELKTQKEEIDDSFELTKEYLEALAESNGHNTTKNPKHFEEFREKYFKNRGCAPDCDYDIDDNCGVTCTDYFTNPEVDTFSISGCQVEVEYQIVMCFDSNGYPLYYQIDIISIELLSGCSHAGINNAFDINYTGGSKYHHENNYNLVIGYVLNQIEENIIYGDIIPTFGADGLGGIMTVIDKFCYAYCTSDNLYKECGRGCCVRFTSFEAEDGYVSSEDTQNIENAAVGNCSETFSIDCVSLTTCDNQLDCDIDF